MNVNTKLIINLVISAHVDHGKSTLADEIIKRCKSLVPTHKQRSQVLDSMPIERSHGVTIKSSVIRIESEKTIIFLIDTPGHPSFDYETKVAISCADLVLLLIDITKGPQAQTKFYCDVAHATGTQILPIVNKIDVNRHFYKDTYDFCQQYVKSKYTPIEVSAKTGLGVQQILDFVDNFAVNINKRYLPKEQQHDSPSALVIDGTAHKYKGVSITIFMKNGALHKGDGFYIDGKGPFTVQAIGWLTPHQHPTGVLVKNEIGFINAFIDNISIIKAGAKITIHKSQTEGGTLWAIEQQYFPIQQKIYCSIYPDEQSSFEEVYKAIQSLAINDNGVSFEIVGNESMGKGILCGFCGLFHLKIFKERLVSEYKVSIVSADAVANYKLIQEDGKELFFTEVKPHHRTMLQQIWLPYCIVEITTECEYIGKVENTIFGIVGAETTQGWMPAHPNGVKYMATFSIPQRCAFNLLEDAIQSATNGHCVLNFTQITYKKKDNTFVSFEINKEVIQGLFFIEEKSRSYDLCQKICIKIKNNIYRQQISIAINGCINGRKAVRETVKPFRKDVTAKLYGGDVTRKRKLLAKQAKGKKKMQAAGLQQQHVSHAVKAIYRDHERK